MDDTQNTEESKNYLEPRHWLSKDSIPFYKEIHEIEPPPVPPPTPIDLISDCYVTILPSFPSNLNLLEIPYIRQAGIRDSINILAPYFKCEDFKHNLVQFWFLDILVDCIWKCQDELRLSIPQQKWVLEWILFALKLLKVNGINKQLFFQLFNEAIAIADEYIQSGGSSDPTPDNLFVLNFEKKDEDKSMSSFTTSSRAGEKLSEVERHLKQSKQYIVLSINEETQIFKLPVTNAEIGCLSSPVESVSEVVVQEQEATKSVNNFDSSTSVDFYKVDMSTPPRFRSLQQLNKEAMETDTTTISDYSTESTRADLREWHNIPRKKSFTICPSRTILEKPELPSIDETANEKISSVDQAVNTPELTPDDIFKAFYEYNLWKLKNEYMNSSKVGWVPFENSCQKISSQQKLLHTADFQKRNLNDENAIFVKSCILMLIKQTVYDYFETTFAFEMAKISLTQPQFLITQEINKEWNIPKEIKGDIKKPMPKKQKKEKVKAGKEKTKDKKKAKGDKSSAKDKKSADKKSDKKSKASKGDKASAKGKKSADKKSDKKSKASEGKKEKKGKDKKGEKGKDKKSKESKSDKGKKEKKVMTEFEKQLVREAENKMFMFPLKDAVDEKFFYSLFPHFKDKKAKTPRTEKSSLKDDKDSVKSKESKKGGKKGKKKK